MPLEIQARATVATQQRLEAERWSAQRSLMVEPGKLLSDVLLILSEPETAENLSERLPCSFSGGRFHEPRQGVARQILRYESRFTAICRSPADLPAEVEISGPSRRQP